MQNICEWMRKISFNLGKMKITKDNVVTNTQHMANERNELFLAEG